MDSARLLANRMEMTELFTAVMVHAKELMEVDNSTQRAAEKEAWELVRAMPTWGKARGYSKGRGQASFDFNYRVTTYSMIANGTPLSAIGPNIIAVVNRTAPWLKPEAPSDRVLTRARFELRLVEEALAAAAGPAPKRRR